MDGIGAPASDSQTVGVSALRPGPLRRARLLTTATRFDTRAVARPDANAEGAQRVCDTTWAGFVATLDPAKLKLAGRWRPGVWDVYVRASPPGVTRRRVKFFLGDVRRPRVAWLPADGGAVVRAYPTRERGVQLRVDTTWAEVTAASATPEALDLSGRLRGARSGELKLELRALEAAVRIRVPLTLTDHDWTATVPFERLQRAVREHVAPDEEEPLPEGDDGEALAAADEAELSPEWELRVMGGGDPLPLLVREPSAEGRWRIDGREVALLQTAQGEAALQLREPRGTLTAARWDGDALVVCGRAPDADHQQELVLTSRGTGATHRFPLPGAEHGGPFEVTLHPGRIRTLAGELPLSEGRWRLCTGPVGSTDPDEALALAVAPGLREQLPFGAEVRGKPMHLTISAGARAVLVVRLDLGLDERGPYNQRRLRRAVYAPGRSAPLRDTVVYTSFRGRQYSDSPRAIHEELVRREAPLEHVWIVKDAAAVVPPTATVVRDGSREAMQAWATSRYAVVNDHFPDWFRRREDQTCVQTWHGTPLKRLGFDVSQLRGGRRRFERDWAEQERNWQHVVSPNRFATPILRDAYRLTGELLETGYPRDDVLAGADLEARSREVRAQLGIPDGVRVVLYAPTFRDHVRDRRGRYRLDGRFDVDRLRQAAGPDSVLLFRKHHYIVDAVPGTGDGFVRDVSSYPDGTELLLAADVLVTDYSSMTVDFANTGRPILFYCYDLETYQDEVRGFYVDFEATVPGPILRTGEDLAEALADVDAVRAGHADRYAAFVERFCELDDGGAAARVVDHVFGEVAPPVSGAGRGASAPPAT